MVLFDFHRFSGRVVFQLSVPVVYIILMSDEIIKVPITLWRYRSYKWLKDVTREAPSPGAA